MVERCSTRGVSLSVGALGREPVVGVPLLGTLKDMWVGLWRRSSLSIGAVSLGTWKRAHLPGTLRDG
jgi:hypothetical protein